MGVTMLGLIGTLLWWTFLGLLAFSFLALGFMGAMHAREMRANGILSDWWRRAIALAFIVCALLDIAFNLLPGTYIFREWPKWGEWMFSSRVKRHFYRSVQGSEEYETAARWQRRLNAVDPDHI